MMFSDREYLKYACVDFQRLEKVLDVRIPEVTIINRLKENFHFALFSGA